MTAKPETPEDAQAQAPEDEAAKSPEAPSEASGDDAVADAEDAQDLEAVLAAHFGEVSADMDEASDDFGATGETASRRGAAVMERMADAAIARYERLPMLNVVLERVVRQFAERLMQMMSTQVDAALAGVEPGRFGDHANEINQPCLLAIVTASGWGGECVIAVDQRLIYTIVEILLGGDAPKGERTLEMREPTPIERRLTQRIFETLCSMLADGFAPLRPTDFIIQRVETNPQFAMIARTAAAAMRARINLDVDRQSGDVDLIIPYTTLEPARAQLGQMFLGENLGRDAYWDQRLTSRVATAPVRLTARIPAETTTLSTAMRWKPGDVVPLRTAGVEAHAVLASKSIVVGEGSVGAKNGRLAIKLDMVNTPEPPAAVTPKPDEALESEAKNAPFAADPEIENAEPEIG